MAMSSSSVNLSSIHPVISCEGAAEEIIVNKLASSDKFVFPADNIIDITRKRKATDIQNDYLGYDYDWPVCVVRVLDSRRERFQLGSLYCNRYQVFNIYTHPEIEMLCVIRENAWQQWQKSRKRPSDYCKQDLGLPKIKQRQFLELYWDAASITDAAREYKRLSNIDKNELCLADIITL